MKQHRMEDAVSYVSYMSPLAESTFTLPDVNEVDDDEQDIDLRVLISCFVWPRTMEVLTTDISFVVDPFYRERRSVDDEVVIRLKTRTARRTLEEHEGGLRFFTLTDNSEFVGSNFVHDERLMEDLLEDLLLEGRITVELEDDGDEIEIVVVARPSGHPTERIFDTASRCFYGSKHPGVVIEDSTAVQASTTESHIDFPELESLLQEYSDFYKDRLGTLNLGEADQ